MASLFLYLSSHLHPLLHVSLPSIHILVGKWGSGGEVTVPLPESLSGDGLQVMVLLALEITLLNPLAKA